MLHELFGNARAVIAALKSAGTGAPKGADTSKLFKRGDEFLDSAEQVLKDRGLELRELRRDMASMRDTINIRRHRKS